MTQAQQTEDGYDEVVHHANVNSSLAYVARKTGFGFQKTERLLELALQRGDLAEGDYSGRKLGRYHDDRARALEAENEQLRAQLAAQGQERKPLTAGERKRLISSYFSEPWGQDQADMMLDQAERHYGITGGSDGIEHS